MLIYEVSERNRVFDTVVNNLRSLGVKPRVKRNLIKMDNIDKHGDYSKKIFNVPLSHQPLDAVQLSSKAIVYVPIFIKQAISYLDKHINQEGLFRKAGSQARQKELVIRLDSGNGLGEKYQGIDVANCLKKYFRDLPDPIIPYAYHDLFVRCGMLKISKIEAILLACLLLPPIHLNTLAVFMDFLKRVSLQESQNKMTTDNLAKVIGPNIMPLRETSMSAMQTRLEAHLNIVKILIDNARNIGVLPKNITDIIQNDLYASTETTLHHIGEDRLKEKKKKHRSGSLTRMFNGLRKIVGKNGSPETDGPVNENQMMKASVPDSTVISSNKIAKKRKVAELSKPVLNTKKRRDSLNIKSTITTTVPPSSLLSPISKDLDIIDKNYNIKKSQNQKYIGHVARKEPVHQKSDKSKILGLNLDRFVSRSRQKMHDIGTENESQNVVSPIERRWSTSSSARIMVKKRKSQNRSVSSLITSPSIRHQRELFPKHTGECYDRVFMDANVNLSDENIMHKGVDSVGRHHHRSLQHPSILNDNLNNTTFKFNDEHSIEEIDKKYDEYVKIPKSEYEEIKNRVSAIESRISQEFTNMIEDNSTRTLPIDAASEVQSEYEKTLGEASIDSIISADHLARRLSKELKIRRSAEHKVIRSPSARKIGNLRRRSQEKPIISRKRVSRTSSWQVSNVSKSNNLTMSPELQSCSNNINLYCADETNSRLSYLHQQLCTLISHTAEHTGSLLSDEEIPSQTTNTSRSIDGMRRAASFHSGERTSESHYYNNRIEELRRTSSQQNIVHDNEQVTNSNAKLLEVREKNEKSLPWKDANSYLEYETPKKSTATTVINQTGRASIAKLRTQNAGMVLAKAKLFDLNESKNSRESSTESHTTKSVQRRSKESKILTPTEGTRKKKCKSPKSNGIRSKISQKLNDSNSVLYSNCQSFDKCGNRRLSPKFDQENQRASDELLFSSNSDLTKSIKVKNINSSSRVHNTTLSVMMHGTNSVNHVAEHEDMMAMSSVNTPHIKKPLSMKTPKSARSLARRPPIDTRRTPLKAVLTLSGTPKRHSPKNTYKSCQIMTNINIE